MKKRIFLMQHENNGEGSNPIIQERVYGDVSQVGVVKSSSVN